MHIKELKERLENLVTSLDFHRINSFREENKIITNIKPFEFIALFDLKGFLCICTIKGWNLVSDFMDIPFHRALTYLVIKQILAWAVVLLFLSWESVTAYSTIVLLSLIFLNLVQYLVYLDLRIRYEFYKKNFLDWADKMQP